MNKLSIDGISPVDPVRPSASRHSLIVPSRLFAQPTTTASIASPSGKKIATQPVHTAGAQHKSDSKALLPVSQVPSKILTEKHPIKKSRQDRSQQVVRRTLIIAAAVVFCGSLILGYQSWCANEAAKRVYTRDAVMTGAVDSSIPDEQQVADEAKQKYTVAPDMPRMLRIDAIGVQARIMRLSVDAKGTIEAPNNIWDTGWYDGSVKPGQSGNAFIDGHIAGPTQPAVFAKLKDLQIGSKISIERGDDTIFEYSVTSVETKKLADIDMKQVLAVHGTETLTIMTCGGNFLKDQTYDSRVIVTAERS